KEHLHESPWVITVPLIALAVPSVVIGWLTIGPVLFGDFFGGAIFALEGQDSVAAVGEEYHGPGAFIVHALTHGLATYLAAAGALAAWFLYIRRPELPGELATKLGGLYRVLQNKYYFDWFNENVIARGSRGLAYLLWKVGDQTIID